jgi:hypothetical protein
MMGIGFDSDEIILKKLRERLHRMTDDELIRFGKDVRRLADNPFQRQFDERELSGSGEKKRAARTGKTSLCSKSVCHTISRGISVVFEPAQRQMLIQRLALPSFNGQ